MKKVLFTLIILCVSLSGCTIAKNQAAVKEPVVINQPTDNTVNGYRKEASGFPEKINANEVLKNSGNAVTNSYCGNKNSKKFHKGSCSALKNTKDENKVYMNNRADFIDAGYKPCKLCNP